LHAGDCTWIEKNCYVDLWIEIVHACRLEPRAMLTGSIGVDFEGDQFTFYKPSLHEIRALYGLEVQELTIWRPLIDHTLEHLRARKLVCVEVDAYWLPDTASTDYRKNHVKTTIAINSIDTDASRVEYFHNAGYFRLVGDDFGALFDPGGDAARLPLYAEYVRLDGSTSREQRELARLAKTFLLEHFARRRQRNPAMAFASRLPTDLLALRSDGIERYHQWAFATVRQFGAAFELAARTVLWLEEMEELPRSETSKYFVDVSNLSKALILKGARATVLRREIDVRSTCTAMGEAWLAGMDCLGAALKVAE